MKHADRLNTFTERVQRYSLKWLIFMVLGVLAYGAGLFVGVQEQHHTEAQKAIEQIKPSFDSSSNPNNTVPPKSPTRSR